MKRNIPTITINNPNKPINISVPNTGGGNGNPFVNWTGNTGNFGNIGNPTTNISTFNPPNMNIPNNIPTGNITQNTISNTNQTNTISGNKLDYSNSSFNLENIKNLPIKEGCYELVSFKNTPLDDLDNVYIDQLLYGKSHKQLDPTKDIYQGLLAKKGVTIVKLDMSNCNIDGDKYSLGGYPIGLAIFEGGSNLRFLQHLNLSNNKIKDQSLYSFGGQESCKTSPCLRSLDLSNNLITDNGVQSLSWSLKKGNLYYLQQLNLSGNKVTKEGHKSLMTALDSPKVKSIMVGLVQNIVDVNNTIDKAVKSTVDFLSKALQYTIEEHNKGLKGTKWDGSSVRSDSMDKWKNCKEVVKNVGMGFVGGLVKCSPLVETGPGMFICAGQQASMELLDPDTFWCVAEVHKFVDETDIMGNCTIY